jgi:hypothetical protein
MFLFRVVAALFVGFLSLSGCAPEAQRPAVGEPPLVVQALPVGSERPGTIEDLMTETIMPNADQLWRAVSYVANEQGVTETVPQTDEDWSRLRASANALISAGDELMITDREILTSDFDPNTASFRFTPDEIRQLLATDPQPWQAYAELLQERTRMTLQAIEFRDVMGLVEFGARINEACEGCHAAYWYRPQGMMAPQ